MRKAQIIVGWLCRLSWKVHSLQQRFVSRVTAKFVKTGINLYPQQPVIADGKCPFKQTESAIFVVKYRTNCRFLDQGRSVLIGQRFELSNHLKRFRSIA